MDELSEYKNKIHNLELEKSLLMERLEFHELNIQNSNSYETYRNKEGRLIYISSNVEKIFGFDRDDYLNGKINIIDFVHPEDKEKVKLFIQKQTDLQFVINFTCRIFDTNKAERFISVSSRPVYNKQSEYLGFRTSIVDITEQKENEQTIAESEIQLKEIFENSLDNIFVIEVLSSDKFRIKKINSSLEKIFNTEKSNIEGKFIGDIMSKENADFVIQNYQKCITTKEIIKYEEFADLPDNKIYYSTYLVPIFDINKNPVKIIGISRDITERKLAEIQLEKYAEEMTQIGKDKDRFLQILAHDLKNPFNQLLGFSNLLLKNIRVFDIEKIQELLSIINQTAFKTNLLLDDLLLWSNSQAGKLLFEPVKLDFYEICEDILSDSKSNSKSIEINWFASEKILLRADLNMFKTILRNLVSNAIKFTYANGRINIFAVRKNHDAHITVSDNGIGIDQDNISKLWEISEPFTTTGTNGEKGTGLGLILCKEFVEKHGGKIWVESELSNGSKFHFTLPLWMNG